MCRPGTNHQDQEVSVGQGGGTETAKPLAGAIVSMGGIPRKRVPEVMMRHHRTMMQDLGRAHGRMSRRQPTASRMTRASSRGWS